MMRIGFVVFSMQRQAVPLSPTDDVPRSALLELGWNAFKTISSRFGGSGMSDPELGLSTS